LEAHDAEPDFPALLFLGDNLVVLFVPRKYALFASIRHLPTCKIAWFGRAMSFMERTRPDSASEQKIRRCLAFARNDLRAEKNTVLPKSNFGLTSSPNSLCFYFVAGTSADVTLV
jgi:hypothetical protein